MSLSAKEAADLVGRSKTGIIKAMREGRISAQKDINGEWRVEPVELFRVYAPINQDGIENREVNDGAQPDTPSLQVKLEQLERRLEERDDVIQDLRQRLDAESEERRKLTLILTDARHAPAPKSWWARLLGGE